MRIVFTDLDGTLLDHETYRYSAALPALSALCRRDVPLILVSSKTRAELELLAQQLKLNHPLIPENGSAVFIPHDYFPAKLLGSEWLWRGRYRVLELGVPYDQVRAALHQVRAALKEVSIEGFGDWSVEQVAAATGLPLEDAARAHKREYTEPFLCEAIQPDLLQGVVAAVSHSRLAAGLSRVPLNLQRGGRFWSLTGPADKGQAVRILLSCYRRQYGPVTCLGLGDSPNDLPLLQAVDRAVVIPGRRSADVWSQRGNGWTLAPAAGPEGWNEAVLAWLEQEHDLSEGLRGVADLEPGSITGPAASG
ncbi:mannosyl-3-phosphoglycerate phosphatase [Leptolyngbya sp. FACHB-261]|uniref:HAD-IIB family hydrolase n=1 Tax=Leptolyngbya sp. FACHB-261 TaxID=2692806 RepID=UPI0016845C76|nr:HAD-IIB family hydrolase [Leptolyngbya sp. FACHB-261]MBD2103786.1 HAD-IIB family hydrolase [Leptolyngbya sp. FACHB-261]